MMPVPARAPVAELERIARSPTTPNPWASSTYSSASYSRARRANARRSGAFAEHRVDAVDRDHARRDRARPQQLFEMLGIVVPEAATVAPWPRAIIAPS